MTGKLRIALLADHLDLVPTVAQWLHQEWGSVYPGGGSLDRTTKQIYKRAQKGRIPTAFIALDDQTPVGTACLLERDSAPDRAIEKAYAAAVALGPVDIKGPETRADLTPWLAAVYVVPEYRRRGIASTLTRHAVEVAKHMGFEALYLYSDADHTEALYRSLEWQVLERLAYTDLHITVMVAVLSATRASTSSPGGSEKHTRR
jgi:GNAT superfamily N-acetyltransferase